MVLRSKLLVFSWLFIFAFPSCLNSHQSFDRQEEGIDTIVDFFEKGQTLLKTFNKGFPNFPYVSKNCSDGLSKVFEQHRFWKFFDASGKPSSGITDGNVYWLGDYKECTNLKDSRYCTLLNIEFAQKPTIFGVCIAYACIDHDVEAIFTHVAKISEHIFGKQVIKVGSHPLEKFYGDYNISCQPNSRPSDWKVKQPIVVVVLGIICGLNFLGTLWHIILSIFNKRFLADNVDKQILHHDSVNSDDVRNSVRRPIRNTFTLRNVHLQTSGSLGTKLLLCFSMIRNTEAIFDTSKSDGILKSVNGIRFFSLCWIILGHMLFYAVLYAPLDNAIYLKKSWLHRISMQAVMNSTVAVDTFFLLSGLLVVYLCLRRQHFSGGIKIWKMYLHRLIRIWPLYLIVLAFYIYIFPDVSSGPFWFPHQTDGYKNKNCREYWWTNVLFINDVYPSTDRTCFEWSWYLAVDMKFYLVLSPLLIYAKGKYTKIAMLVLGLLSLGSLSYKGYLIYDLHATPIFNTKSFTGLETANHTSPLMEYLDNIYTKPYTRVTPYVIGLILGYLLYNDRDITNIRICNRKVISAIFWIVSVIVGLLVVYGPSFDEHWKTKNRIVYGVLFRPAWTLAVAWIIYACNTGKGGIVKEFLHWKAFVPLARLTYSTYLIHVLVIFLFYGSLQQPMHIDDFTFFCLYCGVIFVSYATGYVLSLFIEYPFFQVEKLFFPEC